MDPKQLAAFNKVRKQQQREQEQAQREQERQERSEQRQSKETPEEAEERADKLFEILWDRFSPLWFGRPIEIEVPLNGEVFYSNAVMDLVVEGFKGQGYTCKSQWLDKLDEYGERIQLFNDDGTPRKTDQGKLLFEKVRSIRISQ